jgi:hypothetical protein
MAQTRKNPDAYRGVVTTTMHGHENEDGTFDGVVRIGGMEVVRVSLEGVTKAVAAQAAANAYAVMFRELWIEAIEKDNSVSTSD